ncbi:MAG TPA: hypothetical protein DCM68_05755 [Verrucomicrobia bacterium]|nr:hypothetical protein [Verrucomicrobiota bacterium]
MGAPMAGAQEGGPPKLSTNPGKHVIFPAKGQTAEQQEQDQLAAYTWATQQTGWDPYKAAGQQAQAADTAEAASDATRGAAVGGAARGAILGVAVGAIAGDAGEGAAIGATAGGMGAGMRARQTRKKLDAGMQTGEAAYQAKFADWDKHFVAAMEGKGYTPK